MRARRIGVHKALENLLKKHTALVDSGDCGIWDPETEQEVKDARLALKLYEIEGRKTDGSR
jgi:hypothetical protein